MIVYMVAVETESGFAQPEILFVTTSRRKATAEHKRRVEKDGGESIIGDRFAFVAWDTETQKNKWEWSKK